MVEEAVHGCLGKTGSLTDELEAAVMPILLYRMPSNAHGRIFSCR